MHALVSGADVSGVIRFYDVIPVVGKGATNFLYEGTLTVTDSGNAAIAPVVTPPVQLAAAQSPARRVSAPAAC